MPGPGSSPWGRQWVSPFRAFEGELSRLAEGFWRTVPNPGRPSQEAAASASAFVSGETRSSSAVIAWRPAVDVIEVAEGLVVKFDLPGVEPGLVELSATDRTLTVRGERAVEAIPDGIAGSRSAVVERPTGPFVRVVDLPFDVAVDAIEAEHRLGVLTVRLPRHNRAGARTIPIKPS